MVDKITVQHGDTLTKLIKQKYGLTNDTDVMNLANLIKEQNKLKNINLIKINQELVLPEQLRLNQVSVFNPESQETENMKSNQKNYYRANDVFGDVAIKKTEFPDQEYAP